jgi:DNA modification methylase
MKIEEYKIIEREINKIGEEENKALKEFETLFSNKNLFFELNKNTIKIYLKIIDFEKIKSEIDKLIDKYKLAPDNILNIILKEIDNIGSYGLKSGKRVYLGYNKERKVQGRKAKEKDRGIYFYAQNNNFSKINNKAPEEFINKILFGDSSEVLKKLPDNCIDLVFTSPPYNFGIDYENHKDGTKWEDYFNKLFAVFKECIRVLKYGGRIIVNVQPLFSDYIPIHHIISDFFMKNKLIWKGEVIWDKHNWNCKYTAWGSWQSPSNPYLKNTWEFLEIFCKGDLKHEGIRENIDITAEEFKKLVIAKWDIAPERKMKDYGHPAMFPENLVSSVLKLFSYKGDLILDPFNGAGTTTAVAKKLQRKYLGIDVSEEYNKIAEKRLKEADSTQKTL